MTKKQRIAELERKVKKLQDEITQLRQERFIDARPPVYPYVAPWIHKRKIDDPVPWYEQPFTTGTPLPPQPYITSETAGPLNLGFPSVGEPDGTITALA